MTFSSPEASLGIAEIRPLPTRIDGLHESRLLDSPPEEQFDRITRLVCQFLNVPVARVSFGDAHPAGVDFEIGAYLGAPLITEEGFVLGSLCAIDVKPHAWTAGDQTALTTLAAWVMAEIKQRRDDTQAAELAGRVQMVKERDRRERDHLLKLRAEIAWSIGRQAPMREILGEVANSFVEQLGVSLARVWTVMDEGEHLELQASAGFSPRLDGPQARIKLGEFEIGRVAKSQHPYLTNDVPNEPHLSDPVWVKEQGLVAFAGFPLVLADRTVGVFGAFSRQPISELVLLELLPICAGLAQFVERKKTEMALERVQAALTIHAGNLEGLVKERTLELERTIAEMEEFSYMVSHDLRGPLRRIKTYAAILVDELGPRLGAADGEFLERIHKNTSAMDRLLDAVLPVLRLARTQIELTPVDLDEILRALLSPGGELERLGAAVKVGRLGLVCGQWPLLVEVFRQLVDNAGKFTRPGFPPKIVVTAVDEAGWTLVSVRDNGIGIKPDYQAQVFSVFSRLHHEDVYPGFGLGLNTVRKILTRLNGTVGVESDGVTGSRFWVRLPTAALPTSV
jgi:signal transduction histidine kinase